MMQRSLILLCFLIASAWSGKEQKIVFAGQCMKDGRDRLLPHLRIHGTVTPEVCRMSCATKKYKYSGVECSNECWCGNVTPPREKIVSPNDCSYKCSGNSSQVCGGGWRINVYETVFANDANSFVTCGNHIAPKCENCLTDSSGKNTGAKLCQSEDCWLSNNTCVTVPSNCKDCPISCFNLFAKTAISLLIEGKQPSDSDLDFKQYKKSLLEIPLFEKLAGSCLFNNLFSKGILKYAQKPSFYEQYIPEFGSIAQTVLPWLLKNPTTREAPKNFVIPNAFPPPVDSQATTKNLTSFKIPKPHSNKWYWISTGLYAKQGELVKVKIPKHLVGKFGIQIGTHTDRTMDHNMDRRARGDVKDIRRAGIVTHTYPKNTLEEESYLLTPFGGTIYIEFSGAKNTINEDFTLSFENVIRAPRFVYGSSKNNDWYSSLNASKATMVEMEVPGLIISARKSVFEVEVDDVKDITMNGECVKDSRKRTLPHLGHSGDMNPAMCLKVCLKKEMKYAGVQYHSECWCGDHPPSKELLASQKDCNAKCTGHPSEICGGGWRLNVYSTGYRKVLPNMEKVSSLWTRIMKAVFDLVGSNLAVPFRYVHDVDISIGLAHSGYPMVDNTNDRYLFDLNDNSYLIRGLAGLPLHEIGHNLQSHLWTPSGFGEVTNEIIAAYPAEAVFKRTRQVATFTYAEIFRSSDKKSLKDLSLEGKINIFFMIRDECGWDTYKKFFRYYQDNSEMKPNTDENKLSTIVRVLSVACNKNLVPFFKWWKFPILPDTIQATKDLPEWKGVIKTLETAVEDNCPGGAWFNCCSGKRKCGENKGTCKRNSQCKEGLKCGYENCPQYDLSPYVKTDNCCYKP